MLFEIIIIVQFVFTLIMGIYFASLLRDKSQGSGALKKNDEIEMEKLRMMDSIRLTTPLSESTRPQNLDEIIGQNDGIRALKAALCGQNPQHVLIYGPPGTGKTAAARLILEEAKKSESSPFLPNAKFIEADATIMRYDERNIADPLIGSVHDPIYQGAGAYGPAGIPRPKPGAVTKAHGGILFIDEIGELHTVQINKLLKVLEDRKVFFESAYYSSDDENIPEHIHEIFKNGMPADFRLIGATTRSPEEIPDAIRSRCVEIFFNNLSETDLYQIAESAAKRCNFKTEPGVCRLIAQYSSGGRDAVNMLQTAVSLCMVEHRDIVEIEDIEWVIETGKYSRRHIPKIVPARKTGCVSGLGVSGNEGIVIDIEAVITKGRGIDFGGFTEEETIEAHGRKLKRTSSAKTSVKNALMILKDKYNIDLYNKHVMINVPGGIPIDGPSAGIAVFSALYSAATGIKISSQIAMTGEICAGGEIGAVGGVATKIKGAIEAGAKTVIIPKSNMRDSYKKLPIKVIAADNVNQIIRLLEPKGNLVQESKITAKFVPKNAV